MKAKPKTLSEREAAELVGRSLACVQQRRKAGLLPRSAAQDPKGRWKYDPDLFELEFAASEPMRAPSQESDSALEAWRIARARREQCLARLAELDVAERSGRVVLAADVERRLVEVFTSCKTKLLAVPSRARQALPHLSVADIGTLDGLIREALEDLGGGPRG